MPPMENGVPITGSNSGQETGAGATPRVDARPLEGPADLLATWGLWLRANGWALVPLGLYAVFAFRDLSLPGLYMDSVNPDYMAAWLLRGSNSMPAWLYPDNYLAGYYRLPLLNSLYGGNPTAYLGLLFFSVTGFGVGPVRVFHALLGAAILAAFWWCLRQWRLPAPLVAAMLAPLALDATFVFGWRTQHYLQLFPLLFVAIALGLLGRHRLRLGDRSTESETLFVAGVLLGFAVYGYFAYAFSVAALIIVYSAAEGGRRRQVRPVALPLLVGACAGWLPYVYAHVSILLYMGFASYLEELRALQTAYGVVDPTQGGLSARISVVAQRLGGLVRGRELGGLVLGVPARWKWPEVLTALVLASGPCLLLGLWLARRIRAGTGPMESPWGLLATLLAGALGAHMVFGLLVGRPLALQHYVMLLPVLYLLAFIPAAALAGLSPDVPPRWREIRLGVVLVLASGLALSNLAASADFHRRLESGGGSGPYSDVINLAAAHIERLPPGTTLLFPQWGFWMGVATAVGPRFSVYETASLDQMTARMRASDLRQRRAFAMVVGMEVLSKGPEVARQAIEVFAAESKLHVDGITTLWGRNRVDGAWLVLMSRR